MAVKALSPNPNRDAQGRLLLRVALGQLHDGYAARVYTIHGSMRAASLRHKCVVEEKLPDYTGAPACADVLIGLCDLAAVHHGFDYVIVNMDRIETLRSGRFFNRANVRTRSEL